MPNKYYRENRPTVPPGAKWTAQDGREYTVHRNGHTLIDPAGDYFSCFDLQPLHKDAVDRAFKYAVFEGNEPEMILAEIS